MQCLVTREWNCLKGLQGSGRVALLEEVCHRRCALRFQKPSQVQSSLCLSVCLSVCLSLSSTAQHHVSHLDAGLSL